MPLQTGLLTLDCSDAKPITAFYAALLGWREGVKWELPALFSPDGAYTMLFMAEPDYVPPVWPEENGRQQKQMHLDFVTASLEEYRAQVERALELGAVKAACQENENQWTVFYDPAGHPFCVCRE
ncbi:MAG: VOC family protein [Oscillospiraceae bacterium]|jgi:catechol 2,3-dioxygenase-like lactoylglutathione lyase family enzyme|nr:VOC family protein [Oscillospiraceae bacterium]